MRVGEDAGKEMESGGKALGSEKEVGTCTGTEAHTGMDTSYVA